jgi:hypothetical protein
MGRWPDEHELPSEVREAISERKPGSPNRLLIWLLDRFRSLADADYIGDCLLHLARRMERGFLPTEPVRFFSLMLFWRECAGFRQAEVEVRARETLAKRIVRIPGADSQVIKREQSGRLRDAVDNLDELHQFVISRRMERVAKRSRAH